jgi:hypothetical protein
MQRIYSNEPTIALTQPTPTTVHIASVVVTFGDSSVNYTARTLTIPAPTKPTWYYVTVADDDLPTCQTENTLCGELGNTYMGAILATPSSGETIVLPGGWPAPQAVLVVA